MTNVPDSTGGFSSNFMFEWKFKIVEISLLLYKSSCCSEATLRFIQGKVSQENVDVF